MVAGQAAVRDRRATSFHVPTMWLFLAGLVAMVGALSAIGITRSRDQDARRWTALWTGSSLAFAGLLIGAFVLNEPLAQETLYGASVGYVIAVAVHTLHHFLEQAREAPLRERS